MKHPATCRCVYCAPDPPIVMRDVPEATKQSTITDNTNQSCPACKGRLDGMTCSKCGKTWRVVKRLVDVMEEATMTDETTKQMKYRKKPVVIEAAKLSRENGEQVARWCGGTWHPTDKPGYESNLAIRTLEGTMRADIGDFIIKGVRGEYYPCKPDIFAATYEAVSDSASTDDTTKLISELNGEGMYGVEGRWNYVRNLLNKAAAALSASAAREKAWHDNIMIASGGHATTPESAREFINSVRNMLDAAKGETKASAERKNAGWRTDDVPVGELVLAGSWDDQRWQCWTLFASGPMQNWGRPQYWHSIPPPPPNPAAALAQQEPK